MNIKVTAFTENIKFYYTMTNSEVADEIQQNVAFNKGLHCLLRLKESLGT